MDWLDSAKYNAKAAVVRRLNRYRYPWGGSVFRSDKELAKTAKHFR
jgi:hypothetical protein